MKLTHEQIFELWEAIRQEGDGWGVDDALKDRAIATINHLHSATFGCSFSACSECKRLCQAYRDRREAEEDGEA